MISAAMTAFNAGLGTALSDQVKNETEEEKRKRMAAQKAGWSPASTALLDFGMMSVPGAR